MQHNAARQFQCLCVICFMETDLHQVAHTYRHQPPKKAIFKQNPSFIPFQINIMLNNAQSRDVRKKNLYPSIYQDPQPEVNGG